MSITITKIVQPATGSVVVFKCPTCRTAVITLSEYAVKPEKGDAWEVAMCLDNPMHNLPLPKFAWNRNYQQFPQFFLNNSFDIHTSKGYLARMPQKQVLVTVFICGRTRCRHEWQSKTGKKPKICPKCKQPTWDRIEADNPIPDPRAAIHKESMNGTQVMCRKKSAKLRSTPRWERVTCNECLKNKE